MESVSHGPLAHLTERELHLVRLLMLGFTTQEICDAMHVQPQTVRNTTHRVGRKLGISGRLKIVAVAREAGVEPLEGESR